MGSGIHPTNPFRDCPPSVSSWGQLSDRGIAYELPEVLQFLLFRSLALIEQVEDCGLQIAKVRCFYLSGYCLQGGKL